MLTVLFFKCMTALFDPVRRRAKGIKWGLVSYTVIMFSLATVYIAINLNLLSISYIDNRDFPGSPYLYMAKIIDSEAIGLIYRAPFRLSNLLADYLLVSSLLKPVVARPGT